MSIPGIEQLLYLKHSSLNSAPRGHILDRAGANKIRRKLASTYLEPKPKRKQKPKPSSSGSCPVGYFVAKSNDYWDPEKESIESDPAVWKELAVLALNYYHKKQAVELELIEVIDATHLYYGGGLGFHVNFVASDSTGSPKRILAEVFRFTETKECRVLFCDIMDPNDPDLVKGCRFCAPGVLHPKGRKFFERPYKWPKASD